MKTMLRVTLAAAMLASFAAPALAQQTDEDKARSQRRIESGLQDAVDEALPRKSPTRLGMEMKYLGGGKTLELKFEVGAKPVTLLGVCDANCSKISAQVKNAAGAVVGEDKDGNDIAKVALKEGLGAVTAELKLDECDGDDCWVGLAAYQPK